MSLASVLFDASFPALMLGAGGWDSHLYAYPAVVGSLTSLCSCIWLLNCLRCIPPKYRKRLLLRQLRYVAAADAVCAVSSMTMAITELGIIPGRLVDSWQLCRVWQYGPWPIFETGLTTSALVQTQMALGLLAALKRWKRVLLFLERALPWVVLVAIPTSVVDSWVEISFFDASANNCWWTPRIPGRLFTLSSPFLIVWIVLCMIANVAFYLAGTGKLENCCFCVRRLDEEIRSNPEIVAQRIMQQTMRYALVAISTWLPYWIVLCAGHTPTLTWATNVPEMLTTTFISLNGAMNVWAYASHNQYVRHIVAAMQSIGPDNEAQLDLQAPASPGQLGGSTSSVAFPVTFNKKLDVFEYLAPPPVLEGSEDENSDEGQAVNFNPWKRRVHREPMLATSLVLSQRASQHG